MSIARLRNFYRVGEQVNLTDPPSEEVFAKNVELTDNDLDKELSRDETDTQSRYIVVFEDSPLLTEKKVLLEEADKNEEFILDHRFRGLFVKYNPFMIKQK